MEIQKSRLYGTLSILMIGAFISFLNNTLLNIALPSIMRDLQIGPSTVQWLTTGFMLVNGVLMPASAFMIQKFSVRGLFLFSMFMFTLGTVCAGYSHTFALLLGGRMMQAAGGAVLMPLLMNVMLVSFPVERRGSVMGLFGLIMMFAPAIGPTLSGWIVEHFDWRMLFHFLWPISTTILLISIFVLKGTRQPSNVHLDIFSLVLSSIGFGSLLYGLSSAGNNGWDDPVVLAAIFIGIIVIFWFVMRQMRMKEPLLNFRVYAYPMFSLSSAIMIFMNMAFFSGMILLPIYVQNLRGISPLDAGLMMLPGAIVMAIMSPINGRLFDKYGGRVLSVIGLAIAAVTTYMFSKLTFENSYFYLTMLNTVRSFGLSMVMMPVQTNGLNQLPRRYYPHGTAMNNTLTQVSGAIGTALLVTVMSNSSDGMMARKMAEAGSALTPELEMKIAMESTLHGINLAFAWATAIVCVALALAFFMKRATPMESPTPGTHEHGQPHEQPGALSAAGQSARSLSNSSLPTQVK
jgi:EmrB/QacA subfamily drug resistance transporter